jgi:hypothetical protein
VFGGGSSSVGMGFGQFIKYAWVTLISIPDNIIYNVCAYLKSVRAIDRCQIRANKSDRVCLNILRSLIIAGNITIAIIGNRAPNENTLYFARVESTTSSSEGMKVSSCELRANYVVTE